MKSLFTMFATALSIALMANAHITEPPESCATCPDAYVTCPSNCNCLNFEVYGDAVFLQPNGSSLYYAAEAITLDPSIPGAAAAFSPDWNIYEIKPNYAPGFIVGGVIFFDNSSTALDVNWERLHTSDSESYNVPLSTDMIGPLSDIGPNSFRYSHAKAKATFNFDGVDLLLGQQLCVCKRLYPNIFAGASFAYIHQKMSATYSDGSDDISRTIDSYSKFIGAGPKFGVTFDYCLSRSFYFTGLSSVGLAFGQLKNGTTYQSKSPVLAANGVPEPNVQETSVPNRTQLIPSFDERLGLAFASSFQCCELKLCIGYQTQIFIDAVQSIDMTAPQVLPALVPSGKVDAGVYAVGFERTLSNFILTGPYVSLNIDF